MGLMDKGRSPLADRIACNIWVSWPAKLAARMCAAIVMLLKNENNTFATSKSVARIHIAGKSADDLGNQCGGWTIDWQGKSGEVTPVALLS